MQPAAYTFDRYTLLATERQLLVDGEPARLGGRAFELLLALIERRERTVTRAELFDLVWPGRVVEDHNLQVQVLALRKVLGPTAIATVPGRGYRFAIPLDAGRAEPVVETPRPRAAQTNLPASLAALHGRAADLAVLDRLLAEHRLVTLAGAGGIGKTRLAQEVGRQLGARHADGVWLVALAPLREDTETICSTIAAGVGIAAGRGDGPIDSLARALAPLEALLVLDNCEHVVGTVGVIVQALIAAAPGLRVLATSQEPLHVGGEQVLRLGPLAVPVPDEAQGVPEGAVALFVERVQASDRRFALDATNRAAAIEICRRLDGIPLAIELAAARVPLLGIDGVQRRLDERLRLLVGGSRDAPPRHRTLIDTLEWSHSLLSPEEQQVYRRLGVFAGSFSLDAAQQVVADAALSEWAVVDHLGVLVDKSLVIAEGDGVPRYRLLESTRAYALEALAACGETVAVRRRHAQVMKDVYARGDDTYATEPTLPWLARLTLDLDNGREAFDFSMSVDGEPGVALAIAAAAATFASIAGRGREGRRMLDRAWPSLADASPDWQARAWLGSAQLGTVQATLPPDAMHAAQQAADAFRRLGDGARLYRALYLLSQFAENAAAPALAASAEAEMKRIEAADWPTGLSRLRRLREARRLRSTGEIGAYRDAFAAEASLCAAAGDAHRTWVMRHHVALAELSLGETGRAVAVMDEVAADIRAMGLQREMWQQMAMHALARIELGDADAALPAVREALSLLRVQGAVWWLADHLAWLPALRNDAPAAARLQGWADAQAATRAAQRGPVMQAARDRLAARLETTIAAQTLARLRGEGAAWRDDEVIAVALGPQGSNTPP